jgi:hypothetical protein
MISSPFTGVDMAHKVVVLCLFFTIGLYSCQIDRKPSYQEIPIYPNAQRIVSDPSAESPKSVNFLTSNSVQDVQTFYQTELPKLGWHFEGRAGEHYGYFNLNHDGSSNYKLILRMSIFVTENHETMVTVTQFFAYQGQNVSLSP